MRSEVLLRSFREIAKDIRRGGDTLLFSIGLGFQRDLDDKGNLISKGVLKAFQSNGSPLSIRAAISIQEEGVRWLIRDYQRTKRTYTIRSEAGKLDIYAPVSAETHASALPRTDDELLVLPDTLHLQSGKTGPTRPTRPTRKLSTTSNGAMADVIIMLDYSRSMGGKSRMIMLGISEFIGKLNLLPIDYQIGLIRFAEAKDTIKSIDGVAVTQMPMGEGLIQRQMELPFGGDEHLIDAIVEGLTQIHFRPHASRSILVLTDEPSTGSHPPERAIEICQSLGIRAYVIGVPGKGDFQWQLVQQTNGLFFRMPKPHPKTYPNQ
jgi:hypothetical protein